MNPTKSEIDRAFYRLFENGDLTAIANDMGHSPEYASQMYAATGDRKSNLYRAIRDLRALRSNNMERGEKALALFNEFVERDLMPEQMNFEVEQMRLKTEVDEWETQSMTGASGEKIIEEITDIRMQSDRTLKAAIQFLRTKAANAIAGRRNG